MAGINPVTPFQVGDSTFFTRFVEPEPPEDETAESPAGVSAFIDILEKEAKAVEDAFKADEPLPSPEPIVVPTTPLEQLDVTPLTEEVIETPAPVPVEAVPVVPEVPVVLAAAEVSQVQIEPVIPPLQPPAPFSVPPAPRPGPTPQTVIPQILDPRTMPFLTYWMFAQPNRNPDLLLGLPSFQIQIRNAERIAAINEEQPKKPDFTREFRFEESLGHLTLPEALIYNEYYNQRLPKQSFYASLDAETMDPLILVFKIWESGKVFKRWEITYDPNLLSSEIKSEGVVVGIVRYIVKGGGSVEIVGEYEKKTLGEQATEMASSHLGYHDIWRSESVTPSPTPHLFLTTKHVEIGPYEGRVKLIFSRYVLTPIGGQMAFRYRTA